MPTTGLLQVTASSVKKPSKRRSGSTTDPSPAKKRPWSKVATVANKVGTPGASTNKTTQEHDSTDDDFFPQTQALSISDNNGGQDGYLSTSSDE